MVEQPMKIFWGNNLRIFGVLLLLFAIFLDIPKRTPPFNTCAITLVAVAGLLLIILGTVLLKRKPEK
jgi:hypothetical protein